MVDTSRLIELLKKNAPAIYLQYAAKHPAEQPEIIPIVEEKDEFIAGLEEDQKLLEEGMTG